ncbi:MAG: thioredoxin [Candidatus Bathyarchaeota archaeon]|jgi:thioredoxin 1
MVEDEELEKIRRRKLEEMLEEGTSPRTEQENEVQNKPVKVTDSTFNDIIQKNFLVVVDCWASWCAPCHMIAPVIEELAKDYAGKILFGKLNVDENRRTTTQYQIMGIPALLVFKNGKLVDKIVGALPKKLLEPRLMHHL